MKAEEIYKRWKNKLKDDKKHESLSLDKLDLSELLLRIELYVGEIYNRTRPACDAYEDLIKAVKQLKIKLGLDNQHKEGD